MAKEKELQEQLDWFRKKYTVAEPALPLALNADILKQRALTEKKAKSAVSWNKFVPMVCSFVLVAAVGLSGGLFAQKESNVAAPEMAMYAMEEASMDQVVEEADMDQLPAESEMKQAAFTVDTTAASMLRAVEYNVKITTHLVSSGSQAVLRELYPNIEFYSLSLTGDFWTVIHVAGAEGEYAVAVRADETEVLEEEHCYVVHDVENGKEICFDFTTLKRIK